MQVSIWDRLGKISPVKWIALLAVFTIAIAVFINWFFEFDGIEFNGDCLVYFQIAKYFRQALSDFVFPKPQYWPYGYPALLSLTFFVGSETYTAAQWINLVAGGATIALLGSMALLIARIKNPDQSKTISFIICAMMLLVARGMMLKYQLLLMSDMMGVFWAMLMMLLLWKWKVSKKLTLLAFAGIALGLDISTRYVYVLMLLPAIVILLSGFSLRRTSLHLIIFALAVLLTALPQIVITLKDSSSTLGNELLGGWSVKNFFTRAFDSADGHQTATIPSTLYYALLPFRWEDLTPLGLPLAGFGFYFAWYQLPRWISLSLVTWYFSFYILICGIPIQNTRIAFSLYPPVFLFASLGVLWCIQHWQVKYVFAGVIILSAISITFSVRYIREFIETRNDLKQTAASVAAAAQKNSQIISTSLYAAYLAYPMGVEPFSIYAMSIEQAQAALSDGKKTILAIDEEKFIPQWSNYPAGKTYWWIRNHKKCTLIMKSGEYVVYEVE